MNSYSVNSLFKSKYTTKTLKTLLNKVTKNDLVITLELMTGNQVSLTKSELVNFYLENYQTLLEGVIPTFTKEMIDFINLLLKNHGEIEFNDNMDPNLILMLKLYLIAFPVTKTKQNIIVMPTEIFHFFNSFSFSEIAEVLNANDLVIKYTRGILSYYGYFEIDIIFKYIKEYENLDLNDEDYLMVLTNDGFIYGYDIAYNHVLHYNVEEIENFFLTRKKYETLDYYHLTKNQIINDLQITPEEEEILYFYEAKLFMPKDFAIESLYLLRETIRLGISLDEIKTLLKNFDISQYEYKQLEKLVESLYYNSRLWTLKGNTRNELKIPKMIKFSLKK